MLGLISDVHFSVLLNFVAVGVILYIWSKSNEAPPPIQDGAVTPVPPDTPEPDPLPETTAAPVDPEVKEAGIITGAVIGGLAGAALGTRASFKTHPEDFKGDMDEMYLPSVSGFSATGLKALFAVMGALVGMVIGSAFGSLGNIGSRGAIPGATELWPWFVGLALLLTVSGLPLLFGAVSTPASESLVSVVVGLMISITGLSLSVDPRVRMITVSAGTGVVLMVIVRNVVASWLRLFRGKVASVAFALFGYLAGSAVGFLVDLFGSDFPVSLRVLYGASIALYAIIFLIYYVDEKKQELFKSKIKEIEENVSKEKTGVYLERLFSKRQQKFADEVLRSRRNQVPTAQPVRQDHNADFKGPQVDQLQT